MKTCLLKILVSVLIFMITVNFAACGKTKFEPRIYEISETSEENYSYAVKKDENADVLGAINTVIKELENANKMQDLIDYYTKVLEGTNPGICPVFIPDVNAKYDEADNPIIIGTSADFGVFEFIIENKNNIQGAVAMTSGISIGKFMTGLDIAIISLAADKLNRRIQIEDWSFEVLPAKLKGSEIHVIAAAYSVTDERKAEADFSRPYYLAHQVIISAKNSTLNTLSKLKGKKIGVQSHTTGSDFINAVIAEGVLSGSGAAVTPYRRVTNAYADLKAGRIHAVVIDDAFAYLSAAKS